MSFVGGGMYCLYLFMRAVGPISWFAILVCRLGGRVLAYRVVASMSVQFCKNLLLENYYIILTIFCLWLKGCLGHCVGTGEVCIIG